MDYLSLGPVPAEEDCEQLGPNYNPGKARSECRRFVELLRKTFGNEPEGARFKITRNPHDFGDYLDVVIEFEPSNPNAVDYAFAVEKNSPNRWEE